MNNIILSLINHYICDEINDENICKYHLIHKINYIKQGWNYGLEKAAKYGSRKIFNLMLKKGANNWQAAFEGACEGGNIDIIKLAFKNGVKFVNIGVKLAIQGNKPEVFELLMSNDKMQELGIDAPNEYININHLLFTALEHNNAEITKLVLNYVDIQELKQYLGFLRATGNGVFVNNICDKLKNMVPNINL